VQELRLAALTQLLTQPARVDVEDVRDSVALTVPETILEHTPRHGAPRVAHQNLEKEPFFGCQLQVAVAAVRLARLQIEDQIAVLQHVVDQVWWPARQRSQTRLEFVKGKGLTKIVVGAGVETGDDVGRTVAS